MGKRIRKAAYKLTIADLEQFPLWENCLDEEDEPGQDESTMRPVTGRRSVSEASYFGWVVTDFIASGASRLIGVLQPSDSVWAMSPEIFLRKKPGKVVSSRVLEEYNSVMTADTARIGLTLANERAAPARELVPVIKLVYKVLGLTRAELFPLVAQPRVQIRGWPRSIEIKGFLRPPGKNGRSRVLRA